MCDTGEKRKLNEEDEGNERAIKREKKSLVPEEAPENQLLACIDDVHLLTIFPEELWIIALEKIQDPVGLENFAKASPFFYQLLKPRRVEYLLPDILPLLDRWCQRKESEDGSQSVRHLAIDAFRNHDSISSSDDDDDTARHFSSDDDYDSDSQEEESPKKINLQTVRLVCQCWNKTVEKYMLDHPSNFQIDGVPMKNLTFREGADSDSSDTTSDNDSDCSSRNSFTRSKPEDHLALFKAADASKVNEFMEMFEDFLQNRNPLFHRKLLIEDPSRWNVSKEQVRLFWESVTPFLQKYGQHIWFCEIRLKNNITGFSYYFIIREWLQLMPNLKVLNWTYPLKWEDLEDSEGYEFGSRIPIFLKCKLEDKVRENPLPKLEHLQVFKTDDLPYPIFREFIKRNDHICKLQFHRKFPPPPQYQEFYEYDFANGLRNITELSIILWRKEEVKELEVSATNSSWPLLQKLSVFWGDFNTCFNGYHSWSQIFNFIEKKCSTRTLTNLTLSLPSPKIWQLTLVKNVLKSPASLRLNIPQLCVFEVVLSNECTNLDFLLPLKESLEELKVRIKFENLWSQNKRLLLLSEDPADSSQIIQFNDYYHSRMLESNIWGMFPKLKTIVLKKHCNNGSSNNMTLRYYREHALALKKIDK